MTYLTALARLALSAVLLIPALVALPFAWMADSSGKQTRI